MTFFVLLRKNVCFDNRWRTGFLSTFNGSAGYGLIGRTKRFYGLGLLGLGLGFSGIGKVFIG